MRGRLSRTAASCFSRWACSSFSTKPFKDGDQHCRYLRNSYNGGEVYLVGTCHASSASANAVKEVIQAIKPTAVMLELCEGRARTLFSGKQAETFSPKDFLNFAASFGQNFSGSFKPLQELLKVFGINYGEEFKIAAEECGKIGAKVLYIDQDVNVTVREVRKSLSVLQIANFMMNLPQHASRYPTLLEFSGIPSIEVLMSDKKLQQQLFQLLEDHFPGTMKAILHDRNEYMIKQLRETKGKVVAVVGLAHVDGMEKLWNESER